MKITTIGLGYIGLPTSVLFATHGHEVRGVDANPAVVETLNQGYIHIEEEGLQKLYSQALQSGSFEASLTPSESDAFIIAVPTPNKDDEHKSCDLSYVVSAVESILPYIQKGNLIIVESTIGPRTTEDVVQPILEAAGFTIGEDLFLAHCPERVLPGNIAHELVHNPRIIGGVTTNCTEAAKAMYGTVVQGELIEATASEAELSKLMENTYRDVNIALANELAKIGLDLEINALKVIEMANRHPRVNLHSPGPGVGGHCLAIDPYFVAAASPKFSPLIQTARKINTSMPQFIVETTDKLMASAPNNKVTVFGLTYKGNIDDTRESPAKEISEMLQFAGYDVTEYDPHVEYANIEIEAACQDSSLILVLTDHSEFKTIPASATQVMRQAQILDTKAIVKQHEGELFNLGNMYEQIRKIPQEM
ncbi:nucleotide sugar dehydrogenase [Listeria booriae]|uniref:Nucleotide sugar dehydrogenase n=1 Tax=Listeria booriae TaxID=1552123 RepID=A0A7X1DQM2_9LIST|nr:nucleotide sugar dehydrogenase [Listeria booriae]MBC1227065.1 nucleotide sugar dehydrogenase [Listeria booriae]MBC2166916.1 nucleotide sugar dehydrogenase [Listeria booriae]MBC2175393.1 nucleotide sugar dehydrogenase [Listeria booriae]MBC2371547.1 nucleotide sugar dehydrogenase [Listeria booriae]